jgi:hypothetical protein
MKRIWPALTSVNIIPSWGLCLIVAITLWALSAGPVLAKDLFYTTADNGNGAGAELFSIEVSGGKITTTDIGPTKGGDCVSLARSFSGTLYSMCGPIFGTQQLATIDPKTGLATLFGVPVPGLAVMALGLAPDGTLYAGLGLQP